MKFSRLLLLIVLPASCLCAQETAPPGTTAVPTAPGTSTTQPAAPTTPSTTTPDTITPTAPAPGTPTAPATPPGLLPPPGALPDPSLVPAPKQLTVSTENDAEFLSAVDNAGTYGSASAVIRGPVITLEEALRITLARQPSIKLAQEDLEIARAGLQDAIGVFDTHLTADLTHGRTITPSPDGNILGQKKARQALIDLYRGVRDFRKGKNDGKIEIDDIDDKTGAVKGTNTVDVSGLGGGVSQDQLNLLRDVQTQAQMLDDLVGSSTSKALNQKLINQISGIEQTNQQALRDLEKGLKKSITNFSIQETGKSNITKYEVGLIKTFRSGITVNPKLAFDKGGLTNNITGELEITVPLGQGFGGRMLRAFEDSAYYDLLASELQLRHEISNSLLQTALAYWNTVAALQNYVLLRQSENISDTFVDLTNLRLESEEVPASEVSKARARNAKIVSQVIDAEFALLDARRQLAIAIGLEGVELHNPPFAAGEIPTAIPLGDLSAAVSEMIAKALASRADRAAALQQVRSGKVLAEAAYRDIKPRFDFFFNAGLASAHDGAELYELFSVYNDRWRGMSARGGFSFDWDIVNNPAKATYLRNLALFNQNRITAQDLDRQITNNVLLSASEIRKRKEQLAASIEAARFSRDVLIAERQRYNDGEGSLLDTLQVEEQYTTDLVDIITVKLQFISAVSRLRFESGTVLDPLSGHTPDHVVFSAYNLSSIPDFDNLVVPAPLPTIATDERKRPLPLFQKFGRGNTAEVRAHEAAIKVKNWRQSMLDQPHVFPTAVTGAPIIVSDQPGRDVVSVPIGSPVLPPVGPARVEIQEVGTRSSVRSGAAGTIDPDATPPARSRRIPPPTTENAPRESSRPKPLMKKLFGN